MFCHLLAVWSWIDYLIILRLNSLTCLAGGINGIYLTELLWGISGLIHREYLAQCLDSNKHSKISIAGKVSESVCLDSNLTSTIYISHVTLRQISWPLHASVFCFSKWDNDCTDFIVLLWIWNEAIYVSMWPSAWHILRIQKYSLFFIAVFCWCYYYMFINPRYPALLAL